MLRRLGTFALRILVWPASAVARTRPEGLFFLLLAVGCGFCSVGSGRWANVPLLMALFLLSLGVLALWQGTRSLCGLRLRRTHLDRVFANENLSVTLTLSNNAAWPSAGLVITEQVEPEDPPDDLLDAAGAPRATEPAATAGAAPKATEPAARTLPDGRARLPAAFGQAFVTVVAGRGQERVKYDLALRRRGWYRFSETAIETILPLGLFNSAVVRRAATRLVVYPRLGDVDAAFFRELDVSLEFIRRTRQSRAEEDFRGLREFREGDSPKWIHWRSSARLGKPVVKEFEEPQSRRVLIILDTNLQRLGPQRFPAFETAISFAGTLTRDLVRRGCEVEFVVQQPPGRVLRTTVSRERRNLDALLEILAGLRRDDGRTLADLISTLSRRNLHRTYVLVLGLGSLRARESLAWLHTGDNVVKVVDARSEEFRRIFHRHVAGGARDADDELLPGLGDEEEEAPALHGALA